VVIPNEASIADLAAALEAGETSAADLVSYYLGRVDRLDGTLGAVLETNPDAASIAAELDAERRAGHVRGPLHGVPILLKDNIDTADRMQTTAGSLALLDSTPRDDATVAARLRQAGAVILGKTNLSEWANFRSTHSTSGWSARGGQCRNPYDLTRTPCGSSSGSGVAAASDFCAGAIGTETDGSILCPSAMNGVVGIKPTVGLVSRAGVIPISHTQDTVGPMTRTVADAAAVLSAIAGPDTRDPATLVADSHYAGDYTLFLDPNGLQGKRVGIPREGIFGKSAEADAAAEEAITVMRALGAEIIDPADIPSMPRISESEAEWKILLYEFKQDLNAYLRTRPDAAIQSLADLIHFNVDTAGDELKYFAQEILLLSEATAGFDAEEYRSVLEESRRLSRAEGIDAVLTEHGLDALAAPTAGLPWPIAYENLDGHGDRSEGPSTSTVPAMAGYPAITVPMGFASGLPLGLTFMGTAWSESLLIRLAYAYEQATQLRRPPNLLPR